MNSLSNMFGEGVMKLFILPNGQVLGYDLGGVMEYFHKDRLGSVLAMTNDAGGKEAYYRYDPYGQPRSYYRWSPTAKANTLMYVGAPRDTATGLIRMGARWYDPTQGRFTSADPSGQEQHSYLYAAGNPINNTDPTGLRIFWGGLAYTMGLGALDFGVTTGVTSIISSAFGLGVVGTAAVGIGVFVVATAAVYTLDYYWNPF
ncbi:RHS repeat-associated core domain-containing protein [Luteococcus sp. Sow4_B9]|uniref:RHS repeat-associated core domain-containing protein n=1 Tax=Luteococcus sp. Sow4_B9 TaxID=3438792 RepID=UPI003F99B80C